MLSDADIFAFLREQLPGLIVVYRFGSTASGTTHPTSDVDLAVLATAPIPPVLRFDIQERLAVLLGCDVDLVDLASASTVLRMQVVTTASPLGTVDCNRQAAFEGETYSDYARLNEERREILAQIRREGRVYGG